MKSVPQRHSTVRITGADGTVWEGRGDGLARAMRDLGRRHRAAQAGTRWRLTPLGRLALAHARLFGTIPTGAGVAPEEAGW